ncbi:MAG: branched-chain amino acid ABC transporter permease [Oscillospiraceae bacterium]|nr:branched-chain amino acid ABC transporter permease [Oscillospiraceae bacterium]
MSKFRNVKWKQYVAYLLLIAATCYFGFFGLQRSLDRITTILLEKAAVAMILAVSLNLVVGFLGELSLGHAGFMCVGAYLGAKTAVALTASMGPGNELVILLISLLVGGVAAAVCGVVIGLPALRLRGDYLAIVTLAFGEIVRSIFENLPDEMFGGSLGQQAVRYIRHHLFIIGFILVILTLAIIQNFIRSKHGRAVTSIRDSEIAARATGINVTKYKLMVFTISAFFAGIAGVLFSFTQNKVQPTTFDYNYSIEILVMVVLGGMGSLNGSLIAALLITYLNEQLQIVLTGDLAVLRGLMYALVMILLVIYRNAPALKVFREKASIKNLLAKLKTHDPSKIHDDEASWDRVPTKIMVDEVLSVDIQPQSPYTPDKQWKEEK